MAIFAINYLEPNFLGSDFLSFYLHLCHLGHIRVFFNYI